MATMRRTLVVAGTLLIGGGIVLAMLYAFEGYLRFADPRAHLPPNGLVEGQRYTYGHPVSENRWGFREREFVSPKPQGLYRIMVLGDSMTWGIGLPVEERYSGQLEGVLQREFPMTRLEVLNFSRPGISTTVERDVLREFKQLVQPDLIIVGFCINDTQPLFQNHSVERERLERVYGNRLGSAASLLEHIGLAYTRERLRTAFYRIAEMAGTVPAWQEALQRTYETDSREWAEFRRALHDIKAMSDELGLPPPIFAVLNQGIYSDRPTDYTHPDEELQRFLRWYHQAEQAAAQAGFRTRNFEPDMVEQFAQDIPAVNVLDAHPSGALNRLYARRLAELVAQHLRQTESFGRGRAEPPARLNARTGRDG